MAFLKRSILATAALASAAAFAQSVRAPGWYLGVDGGTSEIRSPWTADFGLSPGVTAPGTLSLKRGHQLGLQAGLQQSEHTRYELEYQRGTFDITNVQSGGTNTALSAGGHYDALTANAYLVEPLGSSRFNLYGGLGAGWGRIAVPQTTFAGASNSGFTWLARAGLEYSFDDQNRAFVQYTYLGLPRASTDLGRRNANTVSIGYRHLF
jgi:opacity protein-like surface antigen